MKPGKLHYNICSFVHAWQWEPHLLYQIQRNNSTVCLNHSKRVTRLEILKMTFRMSQLYQNKEKYSKYKEITLEISAYKILVVWSLVDVL